MVFRKFVSVRVSGLSFGGRMSVSFGDLVAGFCSGEDLVLLPWRSVGGGTDGCGRRGWSIPAFVGSQVVFPGLFGCVII